MAEVLLALLPRPLARWVEIQKLSWQLRRHRSPALLKVTGMIARTADLDRIDRLRRELQPAYRADPVSAAKYADHRFWLPFNVHRAAALGLHAQTGLRILDLGCGPGYFLAVARAHGHECCGVDLPESGFSPVERRVYGEILEALGCRHLASPLTIERMAPLALEGQYDLITAFWICFNRHRQPDEWGAPEWRFFIQDALGRLRPGGSMFLELNAHPERYGALRWYDPDTLAYLRSVGTVEKNRVRIPAPGHGS
jgi:SAM-dependent methyltransferase